MVNVYQLAKEVNRSRSTISTWCRNNNISKFKGCFVLNPIQVELYKAQMLDDSCKNVKKVQKTTAEIKQYNADYYRNKNKQSTDSAKLPKRELPLKEQVLNLTVSNDAILKSRIKKLKLLVEVHELDLLKSAVMRQINTLDNV